MVLENVSERESVVDGVYYCREMNNTALSLLFFLTLRTLQMYQYHHVTKVANVRNLDLVPATDQLCSIMRQACLFECTVSMVKCMHIS